MSGGKEVGQSIQKDEILLEIGTDKVDSEIPSSCAGVLVEILAAPNDVKEVGEVIARINTNQDNIVSSSIPNDKVSDHSIDNKIKQIIKQIWCNQNQKLIRKDFTHL